MSVLCSVPQIPAGACTGITLKSKDGATVVARTIEWAESVMNCMYVVVPRAQELQSLTPPVWMDLSSGQSMALWAWR